jgi:hypothetical protein
VLFIYITRLASNEIFSPSNKIHWVVGRAKDLSALLYVVRVGIRQAYKTEICRQACIWYNYKLPHPPWEVRTGIC